MWASGMNKLVLVEAGLVCGTKGLESVKKWKTSQRIAAGLLRTEKGMNLQN